MPQVQNPTELLAMAYQLADKDPAAAIRLLTLAMGYLPPDPNPNPVPDPEQEPPQAA